MSFLPADYKAPTNSRYMKFVEGDNRFRVMGSAIVGNEFWKRDGGTPMPIRRRMNETISQSELAIDPKTNKSERIFHFWAFPVYNYADGAIQILEIKQKGIQTAIQSLVKNPKWGDPKKYDIVVTRSGQGIETEYSTVPDPKEEVDEGIVQLYKDIPINLNALFDGEDPFAPVDTAAIADDVFDGLSREEFENEKKALAHGEQDVD